jgi:HAD superfamily hydrolase (TIGR01509 family)
LTQSRYDAILFDFDGVLADTEPVHCACWAEVLRPHGIHLDWETYSSHCIGVSDYAMLEFLASAADRPVDPKSLAPRYPVKRELFRKRVLERNPCPPETVDLVRSLGGYRLAVVTSSGRLEVEPVLQACGILPHLAGAVYGTEVVKRLKPAPDPYLLAASLVSASRPLVVEDSEAGVASARAAGFDVIRVKSPAEVPARVREALGRNAPAPRNGQPAPPGADER